MIKRMFLFALLLAVSFQGYRLVSDGGVLYELEEKSFGQCEALYGPVGAEDMTIDQARAIAYIGADTRRAYILTGDQSQEPNGDIWSLDLSHPDAVPIKMEHDHPGVFHPHGIYLQISDTGARTLYVINHITPREHSIDVFAVEPDNRLKLTRQLSFPELISPNDLVVLRDGTLLVTNDHGFPRHSILEKVEDYLGLAWSNVVHFDGEQAQVVIEGLRLANGIALSSDQQELYVAQTTARKVSRYKRGENNHSWSHVEDLFIDSGADNLEWDPSGDLLTGAHPKLFDFLGHMMDGNKHSPSEVIRMKFGPNPQVERLYVDSGAQLSGSSVAVRHGDTLLIGPVFESHMLRCVHPGSQAKPSGENQNQ